MTTLRGRLLALTLPVLAVTVAADSLLSCMPDCRTANLVNMDLSGGDLSGVSFAGANLNHADLTDANLAFANLNQASLFRAKVAWFVRSVTYFKALTFSVRVIHAAWSRIDRACQVFPVAGSVSVCSVHGDALAVLEVRRDLLLALILQPRPERIHHLLDLVHRDLFHAVGYSQGGVCPCAIPSRSSSGASPLKRYTAPSPITCRPWDDHRRLMNFAHLLKSKHVAVSHVDRDNVRHYLFRFD